MVGVAQLVERWIVVPVVEGSNPSTHPMLNMRLPAFGQPDSRGSHFTLCNFGVSA